MNNPEHIRQRYRQFAEMECRGYSDAYCELGLAVSEDQVVVDFIAELPVIQPNLFFAAIQLLTGPAAMPQTGPGLRALVRSRGPEIAEVMRLRRTQTNEVGRCAVLLPALPPGPLALLEVGASAGLCLLLDEFHYELGAARLGAASSPVRLRCSVAGPVPLPAAVPRIVWRRGLDASPVDVHDDDAVRWLLACVYVDHEARRQRLQAAIDLARARPVRVSAGDLVDDLPQLLEEVPGDAQLVVFHSAVLNYVKPERRRAFAGILAAASRQRDIVWLSNEAPGIVHALPASLPVPTRHRYLLARTHFTHGRRRDELLALAHHHGADLAWL